jgi:3-oxoadipate enol-lactonase
MFPLASMVAVCREYPMVARCAADIAARIPGCQQVAVPGADHLLPLRAPTLIADLVSKMGKQAP